MAGEGPDDGAFFGVVADVLGDAELVGAVFDGFGFAADAPRCRRVGPRDSRVGRLADCFWRCRRGGAGCGLLRWGLRFVRPGMGTLAGYFFFGERFKASEDR